MASEPPVRPTLRTQPWHRAMIAELQAVSPGLVYDPVGAGSANASPLYQELRALEAGLRAAESGDSLPLTRARVEMRRPAAYTRLPMRRAAVPRPDTAREPRPDVVRDFRKRIGQIIATAEAAIRSIERSRRYRDTPMPKQRTLYADIDVPRLHALQHVVRAAHRLNLRAAALPDSARLHIPRASLLTQRAQRPLSAMFERWVFLEIVKAFYGTLDPHIIEQMFGPTEDPVTVRDFDERTQYVATAKDRTLRIRFEPWILGRELSVAFEHGLYRGPAFAHAWRPDIVIQIEHGTRAGIPVVTHAWIIDAKLSPTPRRDLWLQVLKYADVRASTDDAAIVRLIALALPATDDGGIGFYESLPTGAPVPLRVVPLLPGQRTRAGVNALAALVAEVRTLFDAPVTRR